MKNIILIIQFVRRVPSDGDVFDDLLSSLG